MVIVVEIEDCCFGKAFLGGWRDVATGTEYYDARTQTYPGDKVVYPRRRKEDKNQAASPGSCFTRGSNFTTGSRDRSVPTDTSMLIVASTPHCCKYTSVTREWATQTPYLPDLRDKLITTRVSKRVDYTTGSENKADRSAKTSKVEDRRGCRRREEQVNFSRLEEDSAVKLQRYYRAYRARLDIRALASLSRQTRAQPPKEPAEIHHLRQCCGSVFQIINLVPPKKRSDFQMLDSVLERWRHYENVRLNRDFSGASKISARTAILHREIELLRSIEMIKTRIRGERKERKYLENLDELAEPEVWRLSNGKKLVLVDTLRVQRAREYRDFYRFLVSNDLSSVARLELLKKLRFYAVQHTCKYAEDLVSLVDQEMELFAIGNNEKTMISLRKRLRLALLRLTMNSCAPKEKFKSSEMKKIVSSKLCKRCEKRLIVTRISDRSVSSRFEHGSSCENCRKVQTGKEAKVAYEPYEMMLRDLKNRESILSSPSTTRAWLFDSKIIYRLVNYVWHGKSGISECDDLYSLVLVRFRPNDIWSPWNNLVLTRGEAALHQSAENPSEMYASTLIKKFVIKNLQAKLRFDSDVRTNFC